MCDAERVIFLARISDHFKPDGKRMRGRIRAGKDDICEEPQNTRGRNLAVSPNNEAYVFLQMRLFRIINAGKAY